MAKGIYDLMVIGGGSAGLVAAAGAGLLGAKVVLINKGKYAEDNLGGECLWTGCVPSKAFIKSAKVAKLISKTQDFGLPKLDLPTIDIDQITARVDGIIRNIEEHHDSAERFYRDFNLDKIVFGEAKFINRNTVKVNSEEISARKIIIATGSSPFIPAIKGLELIKFYTNENIFRIKTLPARLAVIGAGPIGVELGQSFSRLGSKVTIVDKADRLLPREDIESSRIIQEIFTEEGIDFIGENLAIEVQLRGNGEKELSLEDGSKLVVDEILIASGRKANINLDLEKANVRTDKRIIVVNDYMQTSNPNIFACGDVIGKYQFTHSADYEARIVLQNIMKGSLGLPMLKLDYGYFPWTTFCDPEIARVGLSEPEAVEKYGESNISIQKMPFSDIDRALTEGEAKGMIKLLIYKKKLVGAHIIGMSAGEMIHELVLAMKLNLDIAQISSAVHIYPTLSGAIRQTINKELGKSLGSSLVKNILNWYWKIFRALN